MKVRALVHLVFAVVVGLLLVEGVVVSQVSGGGVRSGSVGGVRSVAVDFMVSIPMTGTPVLTSYVYLPVVLRSYVPPATATPIATSTAVPTAVPTVGPTVTPTLPPPSFDGCEEDPDPASAGNFPVRVVVVVKDANPEVVRLENVGVEAVDLTGWRMCSITGNQEHTGVGGSLASGETRDFPFTGGGFIWNNSSQDDGALYNAGGQLVSYWVDPM